ncbi:UDP-N-acetylmuramate dehydrogenase [Kineothrix sp. MB12-C1]|uniref:UDP-N-acetylmuramate dehydrogenase n=1 Tax=Kineothrix sp. MB12-C1 TaxID=3070215 RepID=UPI0027D1F276|nr:UDP-N-acetylmuramate dehydrogenase [Kineothrix sp. MB12-C1]WMC91505.1 UDP-N-acetylmuramate dehydrogenase [Kineothrix sp. MB12-C1]
MNSSIYNYMEQLVPQEDILLDEPMSKHTTFRVGGNAKCLIKITRKEQLLKLVPILQATGQDYFILGNGSNLLVGDKGYSGIIVKLGSEMGDISIEGERLRAPAGILISKAAKVALEYELTGMEFASGIPGTVGGGIVMNAGAYGGEMSNIIESVEVMNLSGEILVLDNNTMEFGYRTSVIKNRPFIVTEAVFKLTKGNKEEIRSKMEELAVSRREKQPLEYGSAGSTFKRPEGNFAGKLIMEAGLRGYTIGGAMVSDKHCGFIVNTGNACALDVRNLIEAVQERVKENSGIMLEREVIYLGEF